MSMRCIQVLLLLTAVMAAHAVDATVTGASTTASDGIYNSGEDIIITVQFSSNVDVTGTASNRPTLYLATGAAATGVLCTDTLPATGVRTLTFDYKVQSTDSSAWLDYIAKSGGQMPLTLNGGAITDSTSGNPIDLSTIPDPGALNSLSKGHHLVIDGDSAKAAIVDIFPFSTPDGSYGIHKTITIGVKYSKPVDVNGIPALTLSAVKSSTHATAICFSGDLTDTLYFTYTPKSGEGTSGVDLTVTAVDATNGTITNPNGVSTSVPSAGSGHSLADHGNLLVDTTAPTVQNVTSTAADTQPDGTNTYGIGDHIAVTVQFSKIVFVVPSGSLQPTITLATGGNEVVPCSGGSGTDTLVFDYVVEPGDNSTDLDYPVGNGEVPLSPNLATIRDGASNDADLALPVINDYPVAGTNSGLLAVNKNIVVDTDPPVVTSVFADSTEDSPKVHGVGDPILVKVQFSKKVTAHGAPTLLLATSPNPEVASYFDGTGTTTITFKAVVQAGDDASDLDYTSTLALNASGANAFIDAAGNAANPLLPVPGAAGSLSKNNDIVVHTPAAVFDVDSPTRNTTKNSAIVPLAKDAVVDIYVTFTGDVTVDTTGGTPSIALNASGAAKALYTATGSTTTVKHFVYTVGANDITSDLDCVSDIALNGATITDSVGNASLILPVGSATHSLATHETIVIDATTAAPQSVASSNHDSSVPAGTTVDVKVTYSAPVYVDTSSGTPSITLNASSGATAVYASGDGTATLTFNYKVVSGDNTADLADGGSISMNGGAITNLAGTTAGQTLPSAAPNSLASQHVVVDTAAPKVVAVTAVQNGVYHAADTVSILVTFNEPVTLTSTAQLALNVGSSATCAGGTGTALTFTYLVAAGDNEPDLDYTSVNALTGGTITDAAGNTANRNLPFPSQSGSLSATSDVMISTTTDTTPPTVSSVSAPSGTYKTGDTLAVTITFTEKVGVTGQPWLVLNDLGPSGHTTPVAKYQGGTGTNTLVFLYTVGADDTTDHLDYAGTNSLRANGGHIFDAANNETDYVLVAPSTAGSLGANSAIVVNPSSDHGKPPPDTAISSETNSGGCGLGSSTALIASLSLLLLRPRRR